MKNPNVHVLRRNIEIQQEADRNWNYPIFGIGFANIYFEVHTVSRQNHSLDNGIHGLNLSHVLILSLVAGGEDGATPPHALEVDHLLLLVPLQLDLVAPGEDRLQASADGDQDGDERASDGEESARGTGDLRPKDDAAVHPPEYTNSQFQLEKYCVIPGNGEEDEADGEDGEGDGEDAEGKDEDSHAGKAEDDQDERSKNHRHEQPVHHEPEMNLSGKLAKTWQTEALIKTYQVDIWGLQVWS